MANTIAITDCGTKRLIIGPIVQAITYADGVIPVKPNFVKANARLPGDWSARRSRS